MALFRRFFYRKPPDRLLEISERVYVFDCCFSTDVLDEDEYRTYINGIVAQLQDHYPDAAFMVIDFKERDKKSQLTDVLSHYGMTVMDYPHLYEGCPLLPLEMVHHFLRSSESWLSVEGQQNVLLVHCEKGGWPVLAFMLAGLLLYRKQYTGEHKTLEMVYKQAPKELLHLWTPLNPQPSQLRYLQYICRRNFRLDWPQSDTPLALDCLILRMLPLYNGGRGCRPVVRVYGLDPFSKAPGRSSKLLFSTTKVEKHIRLYQEEECELVKLDIHCLVQGDVVLECIHLEGDLMMEEIMFRIMFHTEFVRSNVLMLAPDELDVLWDVKDQIPREYRAEVRFSDANSIPPIITTEALSEDDRLAPFLGFHWRLSMEDYHPLKLKRKDLEDVSDDFSEFSLCSPARKIRRLDADLPPIVEDNECEIPIVFEHSLPDSGSSGGIRIEELPDNDEKAIVLFNPSTLPRSPSNFSVSVDPRLISALKNKAPWSDQSSTWRLDDDIEAAEKNNCLAVVPWVPSQFPFEAVAEFPPRFDNAEMMDAQVAGEAEEMEVEDCDTEQRNVNEAGGMMLNEGFHQWQQQHCLIPQPPQNASSAPIVWYQ